MSRLSYNKSVLKNLAKVQEKTELKQNKIELNKLAELDGFLDGIERVAEKGKRIADEFPKRVNAFESKVKKDYENMQDSHENNIGNIVAQLDAFLNEAKPTFKEAIKIAKDLGAKDVIGKLNRTMSNIEGTVSDSKQEMAGSYKENLFS